jgi:hypothetical protein
MFYLYLWIPDKYYYVIRCKKKNWGTF